MVNEATKKKVLGRPRRIAEQVEGIARMVEDDRYCAVVLLQVASAQAALGQAGKVVPRSHMDTCVSDGTDARKPAEPKQKLEVLLKVFSRHGCMRGTIAG